MSFIVCTPPVGRFPGYIKSDYVPCTLLALIMASFLGTRAPLEEPRREDDLIAIGISTPKEDIFILKMT